MKLDKVAALIWPANEWQSARCSSGPKNRAEKSGKLIRKNRAPDSKANESRGPVFRAVSAVLEQILDLLGPSMRD